MDFVKESVDQEIIDWTQWMDKYIYKHSELYESFKTMGTHIPYNEYSEGELIIWSPYQIWINMLRSPKIIIEPMETAGCGPCQRTTYRNKVLLDGMVIAVFDKFGPTFGTKFVPKFGPKYKYVRISHRGFEHIMSDYLYQLV